MMMQEHHARVPHFTFKDVERGEDEAKSNELGYPVPKLVTYIYVLPHGVKDAMEFEAEEFIARKAREAKQGHYEISWVKEFKDGLALFREGKAIPRTGTPLITYERLLKSRREQLAPRFPTVEDLAAVPDSGLGDIGLDGRVIRDLARMDIQAKKDLSPVVKELANANETIRRQESMLEAMSKRLEALEAKQKTK